MSFPRHVPSKDLFVIHKHVIHQRPLVLYSFKHCYLYNQYQDWNKYLKSLRLIPFIIENMMENYP